jgi:hypothetical protein
VAWTALTALKLAKFTIKAYMMAQKRMKNGFISRDFLQGYVV